MRRDRADAADILHSYPLVVQGRERHRNHLLEPFQNGVDVAIGIPRRRRAGGPVVPVPPAWPLLQVPRRGRHFWCRPQLRRGHLRPFGSLRPPSTYAGPSLQAQLNFLNSSQPRVPMRAEHAGRRSAYPVSGHGCVFVSPLAALPPPPGRCVGRAAVRDGIVAEAIGVMVWIGQPRTDQAMQLPCCFSPATASARCLPTAQCPSHPGKLLISLV